MMHIEEVLKKIEKMNSVVEKLDFVYRVFDLIEEKEEAEKLVKALKDELAAERATFVPKVHLSEPKFEIKQSLEETMISSKEEKKNAETLAFKLDVDVKLWENEEFKTIPNPNYTPSEVYSSNYKPMESVKKFEFKKYKLD